VGADGMGLILLRAVEDGNFWEEDFFFFFF